MKIKAYLWDKLLGLCFNLAGIIGAFAYLSGTADIRIASMLAAVWIFALALYYASGYFILKNRINKLNYIIGGVEDKFLLSEILPRPYKAEDSLYYEAMRIAGKSAIEKVSASDKERAEYYDYISMWAHEIKTPIAAADIICRNGKGKADAADCDEILIELDKINNLTQQVLFEARSGSAEKDLFIKETDLAAVVNSCVRENKLLLINSGIKVDVDVSGAAYTDEKWISFVLKQILYNGAQYAKSGGAELKITSGRSGEDKIKLSVRDNGIGILQSELPRIFEKGFTGSNGRRKVKSTGMGLYLCKKLCAALGVEIEASSNAGEYTEIALAFFSNLTKS